MSPANTSENTTDATEATQKAPAKRRRRVVRDVVTPPEASAAPPVADDAPATAAEAAATPAEAPVVEPPVAEEPPVAVEAPEKPAARARRSRRVT
ncbi:MAG: hypothetical protein J7503_16285, partial [Cellulomonas iranensis]|uniref:hypothetical protein n=1 Tax=Cellulomonas iranensis TaxID=76862 RepID=UPI001B11FBFE